MGACEAWAVRRARWGPAQAAGEASETSMDSGDGADKQNGFLDSVMHATIFGTPHADNDDPL